mmetsp:Transcript_32573/g.5899  ORF Transcript_32573/g.5899 Transcript_32573/m.5899 type:complete len:85 (-) Transcript_32573:657-911(-)
MNSIENTGESDEALRKLSMVTRFLGENEERKRNVQESVDLAKRAVRIDMKSSENWYVLGNAHFTNFFTSVQGWEDLKKALSAYN